MKRRALAFVLPAADEEEDQQRPYVPTFDRSPVVVLRKPEAGVRSNRWNEWREESLLMNN